MSDDVESPVAAVNDDAVELAFGCDVELAVGDDRLPLQAAATAAMAPAELMARRMFRRLGSFGFIVVSSVATTHARACDRWGT